MFFSWLHTSEEHVKKLHVNFSFTMHVIIISMMKYSCIDLFLFHVRFYICILTLYMILCDRCIFLIMCHIQYRLDFIVTCYCTLLKVSFASKLWFLYQTFVKFRVYTCLLYNSHVIIQFYIILFSWRVPLVHICEIFPSLCIF